MYDCCLHHIHLLNGSQRGVCFQRLPNRLPPFISNFVGTKTGIEHNVDTKHMSWIFCKVIHHTHSTSNTHI